MTEAGDVAGHFGRGQTLVPILWAVEPMGKDLGRLVPADFAPVDELHIRGRRRCRVPLTSVRLFNLHKITKPAARAAVSIYRRLPATAAHRTLSTIGLPNQWSRCLPVQQSDAKSHDGDHHGEYLNPANAHRVTNPVTSD
jgi:hypothetical protein